MKLYMSISLSTLLLFSAPCASEATGAPPQLTALINKDQKRELSKQVIEIKNETAAFRLNNRKDSLLTSVKTHAETYTKGQIAYKLLVVWYIDKRIAELNEAAADTAAAYKSDQR